MFTKVERVAIFSLASILLFRMLGLFIVIPVFSPYLQTLANSTPFLIGLTMGVYGLTQAICQIPMGFLSDYLGRKIVVTLGLAVFFFGSLIAGAANDIWFTMLGRALQGAGAISGVLLALLSDLTSDKSRTKAMSIIGVSIGAAFILAFILGPILNSMIAVKGIFYLIAILVIPVVCILWFCTPNPNSNNNFNIKNSSHEHGLRSLYADKELFTQLAVHGFGIFSLHGILMADFVALPLILKNLALTSWQQAEVYVAVFIVAVLIMLPVIIISEKKKRQDFIVRFSVALLILSQIIFLFFNYKLWGIIIGLIVFFTGFNILEATLPSLVSKLAPKTIKGTVMGAYSTAQFLGPMLGGLFAGVLFKYCSLIVIFVCGGLWAIAWFLSLEFLKIKK